MPDVTLLGATYPDVPTVRLPSGNSTADFNYVGDTTAVASDVLAGKLFHTADGTLTAGTGSGGESDPPNDGKTHIFIDVPCDGFTYAPLLTRVSGSMSIDWGDGTTQIATASNPTHTYSSAGEYEVTMKATGTWRVAAGGFGGTSQTWMTNLTVEANQIIARRALAVRRAYLFDSSLVFYNASSFRACINMTVLDISGVNDMTQSYHAGYCLSLRRAVLPVAATMVPSNTFYGCASLNSVEIPSSVTIIKSSAFYNCILLTTITIPSAVATIEASAFGYCKALESIHFLSTTPPTVANANAWSGLPTTCVIHVPAGTLADYTAATNYPDPATYTYMEDAIGGAP